MITLLKCDVKCTWLENWELKLAKAVVRSSQGQVDYPGSSAHVTAVSPGLALWLVQEERVTQSRGRRNSFRRLVLQHLLQEIEKKVVLCPM